MAKKIVGLIGGIGWPATILYYRTIIQTVSAITGGSEGVEILINSVNQPKVSQMLLDDAFDELEPHLVERAQRLETAGADFLLLACNTAHAVADAVQSQIQIPLLHIAETVADSVAERGLRTIGLLSTTNTIRQGIYDHAFAQRGISIIYPDPDAADLLNEVIYDEIVFGNLRRAPTAVEIAAKVVRSGAEALILGCTDLSQALDQQHLEVPLIDSSFVHAERAGEIAMGR